MPRATLSAFRATQTVSKHTKDNTYLFSRRDMIWRFRDSLADVNVLTYLLTLHEAGSAMISEVHMPRISIYYKLQIEIHGRSMR